MKKTLKNRILDQLFYHKYDWKIVTGNNFDTFTAKVMQLKSAENGYEVYKPVGDSLRLKVVMYRKKGYQPKDHWTVKFQENLTDTQKEKLKGIGIENTHPYLLAAIILPTASEIYKLKS